MAWSWTSTRHCPNVTAVIAVKFKSISWITNYKSKNILQHKKHLINWLVHCDILSLLQSMLELLSIPTWTSLLNGSAGHNRNGKLHNWPIDYYEYAKGQIKPKAGLACRRFSQKTNERIWFVCCEKQKSKQNKSVCSFFSKIYGANLFSVLSDL